MSTINQTEIDSLEKKESDELPKCCQKTIESLVDNNPMMACHHCKRIIKCFENREEYDNYVVFCQSRKRRVFTYHWAKYFVVTFLNYDNFSA